MVLTHLKFYYRPDELSHLLFESFIIMKLILLS